MSFSRPARLPGDSGSRSAVGSAAADSKQLLIEQLRGKIRRVETAARNQDAGVVSSGSAAIDRILPAGGYRRGTIVHWLAEGGSGVEFLSMRVAREAIEGGGALVVVDPHGQFYPPAAHALGICVSQLIVLSGNRPIAVTGCADARSPAAQDFLWAIDQSLRCNAVAAVWGELPEFGTPQLAVHWQRRFQLSAETSGCLGLFVRQPQRTPSSWAEIEWHIQPQKSQGDWRRFRATLWRCRGGAGGRSLDLEIEPVTGTIRLSRCEHAIQTEPGQPKTHSLPVVSQLADSTNRRRAARA
jgi:hypothetical protein